MNPNRYCAVCKHDHGGLYVCEHYPPDVKAFMRAQKDQFVANLRDPAWLRKQADRGVPPAVLAIFQCFAGIES